MAAAVAACDAVGVERCGCSGSDPAKAPDALTHAQANLIADLKRAEVDL